MRVLFPVVLLVASLSRLSAQPALSDTVFVNDFQNSVLARGGSNLLWHHVDAVDPDAADPLLACIDARDPYGILANYHRGNTRVRVLRILGDMRSAGQQVVSTGIVHLRAPAPTSGGTWGGTLLDSTGGNLHPQIRRNLERFLADIRGYGFREILFRYFPQGDNTPTEWNSFSESHFQENLSLIRNTRALVVASGLDYRIDLMVEGMPRAWYQSLPGGNYFIDDNRPHRAPWSEYARRLWREYVAEFGHQDTVGFSFVSDADPVRTRARVRHLGYVYQLADGSRLYPPTFAVDIYGGAGTSEQVIFERHHTAMAEIGRGQESWIVAESYFDDPVVAEGLKAAMENTGRRVEYFTQWPFDRSVDDCGVNVAAPISYESYLRQGF